MILQPSGSRWKLCVLLFNASSQRHYYCHPRYTFIAMRMPPERDGVLFSLQDIQYGKQRAEIFNLFFGFSRYHDRRSHSSWTSANIHSVLNQKPQPPNMPVAGFLVFFFHSKTKKRLTWCSSTSLRCYVTVSPTKRRITTEVLLRCGYSRDIHVLIQVWWESGVLESKASLKEVQLSLTQDSSDEAPMKNRSLFVFMIISSWERKGWLFL